MARVIVRALRELVDLRCNLEHDLALDVERRKSARALAEVA